MGSWLLRIKSRHGNPRRRQRQQTRGDDDHRGGYSEGLTGGTAEVEAHVDDRGAEVPVAATAPSALESTRKGTASLLS